MTDHPQIFGVAVSTFAWTARLVCAEKGAAYAFIDMVPGGVLDGVRHPFSRVPVLRWRGQVLYETLAIARYLDRELPGPPLQPPDSLAQAHMDQWISATCDYLYDTMVTGVIWPRLVSPLEGGAIDEDAIAGQVRAMTAQLGEIDQVLAAQAYLAGPALTLAELFLAPVLYWLDKTPEGHAALTDTPSVRRWLQAVTARPAFQATTPMPRVTPPAMPADEPISAGIAGLARSSDQGGADAASLD